ncbi:MAG: hypothetical protein L0323_05440 [Planctomycetes bacterium]|nr:hypothetical protein [Planctomycetota bacterium]
MKAESAVSVLPICGPLVLGLLACGHRPKSPSPGVRATDDSAAQETEHGTAARSGEESVPSGLSTTASQPQPPPGKPTGPHKLQLEALTAVAAGAVVKVRLLLTVGMDIKTAQLRIYHSNGIGIVAKPPEAIADRFGGDLLTYEFAVQVSSTPPDARYWITAAVEEQLGDARQSSLGHLKLVVGHPKDEGDNAEFWSNWTPPRR